ncbi:hypothetical protein [Mariniflexile sp. HMF6888]|uniref:hypothetical protein n=1 Tax=Mariniflexile sp. HMF6888 TaxID=3373086 RepID=UPI0037B486E5
MGKTVFKSKLFHLLLICYLISLLSWNIFNLISGNLNASIPITIQATVLFFILTENKHAKFGIKVWAIVIIISHSISLLAKLFKIFVGDEIIIADLLNKIIFASIGILIYLFNEKYVEIEKQTNL